MGEDDANQSATKRVRAASFAASALIVAGFCIILLIASRVTAYLEDQAIQGVEVSIEQRPRAAPPVRARQRPSGVATTNTNAAPEITPLPVGPEVLARVQSCLNPHRDQRPADCPREVSAPDYVGTAALPLDGVARPRLNLRQAFTTAEIAVFMADPPCVPGVRLANAGVQACARFGITPDPPSRSPEEICEAGLIGPCHPPDMPIGPRLAHTQ